jgi:hypothetical protein
MLRAEQICMERLQSISQSSEFPESALDPN